MASLFWVAGTAAYDGVTNRFATTSGGSATVAVINAGDTVTFDANSPAAAAVTTSAAISCTSLTLASGFTGSLTMSNSLTVSGTLTHTQGGLNVTGQTCSFGQYSSSNSNIRTLNITNASITITGTSAWSPFTTTNLSFTSTGSTINLTGASAIFQGGGLTYATVNFTAVTGGQLSGANTFGTLSITGGASRTAVTTVFASQTVTTSFVCAGNSILNRLLVTSSTQGTAVTTTAAAVTLSNTDFRDIAAAGAASPFTGTSLGDVLGNTNITFTTPTTRYWIGGTGNWSDTTHWSASSGGAGSASVPLSQDNVFFTASSGAGTVTNDMARLGKDIDMSASSVLTVASTVAGAFFGSMTLKSGLTMGYNPSFSARSSVNLTSNGATFSGGSNIVVTGYGITVNLMDNITAGSGYTFFHRAGTVNTNNVTISMGAWAADNSISTRTLNAGSSVFNLASTGAVWNISDTTSLTMNMGTSNINFTSTSATSRTFAGAGFTYGTLRHVSIGSASLTLSGSNTFNTFVTRPEHSVTVTAGTTNTFTNLLVSGVPNKLATFVSSSPGSIYTFTTASGNRVVCDYLSLTDCTATGGTWYAGSHSSLSNSANWLVQDEHPLASTRTVATNRSAANTRTAATSRTALRT